jgi:hypothetical protein
MSELAASPEQLAARPQPLARFAPVVLISLVGLIMAAWTWNKWPDVFIDFGRELHLAWQISEGRALYHDLAYFSGPLSPHVNALAFALFGVGLRTIVWLNIAILVAIVLLLYRLVRNISDRFTATAACLVLLVDFAFAQYVFSGNYNYVCPYSHELTHGLLLSLIAIYCLNRNAISPSTAYIIAAGLAIGLVFLTRAEIFAACMAAVVVHTLLNKPLTKGHGREWIVLAACAASPLLIAWALLSCKMPASEALAGLFSSWTTALKPRVSSLAFFREGMGTDKPVANILTMLKYLGGFIAVMSPAALAAWWWKGKSPKIPAIIAFIAYALVGAIYRKSDRFFETARILPFIMIALTILLWRARLSAHGQPRSSLTLALTLASFAFVLTGKMILHCRLYQYGFILAMPATIMLVVALLHRLPSWLNSKGRAGVLFRGAAAGILLAASLSCIILTNHYISRKHTSVGTGPDKFLVDDRGASANIVLSELTARLGPNQTFGVLPEGVMLNYLARRPTGWRHTNFMPTEVSLFGEEAMLADIKSHPPDYLVLIHKETSEFGFRFFGKDYGQKINQWIKQNYSEMGVVGARPFVDPYQFGVLLLQRKPGAGPREP